MTVNKNFVIKNGLEVNTDLIFADKDSNKVGIATTTPIFTLDVNGGIGADLSYVSGISTVNNLVINGTVSVGNSIGVSNQYLVSTGAGVTWKTAGTRTSTVYSASVSQTLFSVTYQVGLVDVYINGVRLVPPPSAYAEFIASNGTDVTLIDSCFGGEIVEIVAYN